MSTIVRGVDNVDSANIIQKDSNGNVVFPSGGKIQGDFSNATPNSKTILKTNVTNGVSVVHITPDGTGSTAGVYPSSSSDLTNAPYVGLAHNTVLGGYINCSAYGSGIPTNFTIKIAGTDAMVIDTSRNIGIGVTPSAWFGGKHIQTLYSAFGESAAGHSDIQNNSYEYANNSYKYIGTGLGASRYVANFGGHSWRTAPSGTAGNDITWTNAMTLDVNGNLLVGVAYDTATPNNGVTIRNTVGTTGNIGIGHASGTPSGNNYLTFAYAGSAIGSIVQNGTTAVSYSTTSDYRLKENIRPSDCKRFMDIKFVDYERIDGRHECGVIAHELQEVYPDLVTGEKDAVETRKVEISPAIEEVKDEDGSVIVEAVEATYEEQEFPVYQQVNYMGLIARIGTVVQQQAKLIEAMQLEINELKGAK